MLRKRLYRIYIIIILFISGVLPGVHAQNTTEQKEGKAIIQKGKQAFQLFFNNQQDAALRLLQQQLQQAKKMKDGQYAAYLYAISAMSLRIMDNRHGAQKKLDSALFYAQRTQDKRMKGYVQYCKGWLQVRNNEINDAIKSFTEGLRLLDVAGTNDYKGSIYSELYGIYADWGDYKTQEKYARLNLQLSNKIADPKTLFDARRMMATTFESQYRNNPHQKQLLDSSFHYYSQALQAFNQDSTKMVPSDRPMIALNIANLYSEFRPDSFKDKGLYYAHMALDEGIKTRQYSFVASAYGILSEYDKREGHYKLAREKLLLALSYIQKEAMPDKNTMAKIYLNLSDVAEKGNNYYEALEHYRKYVALYRKIFDAEKMAAGKEWETKYETEKKEAQLAAIQAKMNFNKRLNTVYFLLTASCLIAFGLLLFAYRQRAKSMRQQDYLHKLEIQQIRQASEIANLSAMLDGQENERARLARDLHDGLGGLLSGTKIELSALSARMGNVDQESVLKKSLRQIDEAVEELRVVAHNLMPDLLLKHGLETAILHYTERLKRNGLPINAQVINVSNHADKSREVVLYRIIQELVNNAIKHAAASQIFVQLQQREDSFFLTVEDDGKGFDSKEIDPVKSAGFANIRARLAYLKGEMHISSKKGTGTTIEINCPIN